MEKQRSTPPHEEAPGLQGPDYVALVIEWDDLADALEDTAEFGTAAAPGAPRPDWNRVDEASMESFPASDPPPWGSAHAVAEAAAPEDISDEVTSPFHARARPGHARQILLGVAAVGALFSMIEGMRRLHRRA